MMKSKLFRINTKSLPFSPLLVESYSFKFYSVSSENKMEVDVSNEVINSSESQTVIKENTTEILVQPGKKVFYNPVQEFNRDLSVLSIKVHLRQFREGAKENDKHPQKPFRILEALSATGLRSIRYAKEIPGVQEVIANDICSEAIKHVETNIKHNGVESVVTPSLSDAVAFMVSNVKPANRFQVVDLDPYGSPAPFLDSAVQCVADGGLLLVTCTDMGVLCGNYPETSFAKYGSLSLKLQAKHEMAIRIVLHSIQAHASRYKRYIIPLLSISADFYIRIFVKISTSASACKDVVSKISMVYDCCGCDAHILQPLGVTRRGENNSVKYSLPHLPELGTCRHCGGSQRMGGPIWNGPIHDKGFVAEMIKSIEASKFATSKRLLGMLTVVQEELSDVPLYYKTSDLASKIKAIPIPLKTLRSAILNAGYRVSISHAARESIKTDAPMEFIWDLFRAWVKENPVREQNILPGSPAEKILKTPPQHNVDFSLRSDAIPESVRTKLVRFQVNPSPHWGPGSRATVKNLEDNETKKREHSPADDEKDQEKRTRNSEN